MLLRKTVPLLVLFLCWATTIHGWADTLFTYNFDNLTAGQPLASSTGGQDNWFSGSSSSPMVDFGTGVDTSLVAKTDLNTSTSPSQSAGHPFSTSITYTPADIGVWGFDGSGLSNQLLVIDELFGQKSGQTYLETFAPFTGTPSEYFGDPLSTTDWYQFRLVVDFSVFTLNGNRGTGGLGTLFYRDLTLGQTTFTEDGTIRNVDMQETISQQPGGLEYASSSGVGIFLNRVVPTLPGYIDNIDIERSSAVPEPSTFNLLGIGLIAVGVRVGQRFWKQIAA